MKALALVLVSFYLLIILTTDAAFGVVGCRRPRTWLHMSVEQEEVLSPSTLRAVTICNLDKSKEPQLLCEFLMEVGACSTSITDADRDTPLEQAIYQGPGVVDPRQSRSDDDAAVICGDAAVGRNVWNKCNVTAHFPSSTNLSQVAQLVEEVLDIPLIYELEQVPDRDWVIHVQQGWKPIVISGLVVRFPWHSDDNVAKAIQGNEGMVELRLEGGIAFGTGEHPTTQLCLSWIQQEIGSTNNAIRLMDYGCGSGVLGLAACAFSENVEAVGIDIDADAVRIANANAANNRLDMESYLPPLQETPDGESKSVLLKAHSKLENDKEILPKQLNGPIYDKCVANILAAPLVTLAPAIASLVQSGGSLGLSGILAPQAQMVIDAYDPFFENVTMENEMDGWILISGKRRVR